jgi:hypothetical protein
MWPVLGIHVSLPEHLHACEDTLFLVIRCVICGWSVWFSVPGVKLEELQKAVNQHRRCPRQVQPSGSPA